MGRREMGRLIGCTEGTAIVRIVACRRDRTRGSSSRPITGSSRPNPHSRVWFSAPDGLPAVGRSSPYIGSAGEPTGFPHRRALFATRREADSRNTSNEQSRHSYIWRLYSEAAWLLVELRYMTEIGHTFERMDQDILMMIDSSSVNLAEPRINAAFKPIVTLLHSSRATEHGRWTSHE